MSEYNHLSQGAFGKCSLEYLWVKGHHINLLLNGRERGGERGRESERERQKCKQMGQSLYYSCNFSVKWKLYQNKKILPKTKQANKPAAVVSSQATNTGSPQPGGLCFLLGREPARSMAIPEPAGGDGQSPCGVGLVGCNRFYENSVWIIHKLVCSPWQWLSCSSSREALCIAVLCQMIHRYHAANREVISKCANCAQISSLFIKLIIV